MTRQEYMQQLAALLAAMPEAERRDALDYYEEYFDAAGPEKEAQTIQELGSPQNVAEKIWEGTGAQFGTPMPDNSMPEQGSRRRKSPVWIVLAILAILIVVLLVFIGSFKIVTKYQYSIAESATAEEVPPQEATGGATENMDESMDENTETAITKESAKNESTNRLESSTMTLDAKQAQTMVLDLDCGEVAFVRSNAADEITLRFENFYSDWLERTVDESGFSVRYKIPKGYIFGSDPTPTLSIALPEMELEQIELNLNLGSADLGTLKAKSIQADLALGSLYADELQTGQLDATLALGSAELGTVQAERVTIENADHRPPGGGQPGAGNRPAGQYCPDPGGKGRRLQRAGCMRPGQHYGKRRQAGKPLQRQQQSSQRCDSGCRAGGYYPEL